MYPLLVFSRAAIFVFYYNNHMNTEDFKNNFFKKADDLDVGKLKTVPVHLIKLRDVVDNEVVKNTKFSKFSKSALQGSQINNSRKCATKTFFLMKVNIPGVSKKTLHNVKVKEGNNKLMSYRKDDEKLLENHKANWTKTKDFKNNFFKKVDDLDVGKLKTVPVHLTKLSDVVDNEFVKNTKLTH